VLVSPGIDLVVRNGAPVELAGRIALHGRVLFDDESTRENSLDRYHAQDLRRRRAAAAAQPPRVR
jgi:hypothetical protein